MVPVQCRDVTVAAGLQEHSNRLCGLPIRTQNAQLRFSTHWSITKHQWLQETAWEASSVPQAHGHETTFALHGSESPTDARGRSQRTPNIPPSTLLIGGRSSSQSARPRRLLRTDLGARPTAQCGRSRSPSRENNFRNSAACSLCT